MEFNEVSKILREVFFNTEMNCSQMRKGLKLSFQTLYHLFQRKKD